MTSTGFHEIADDGHVLNHNEIVIHGCVGNVQKEDEIIFGTVADDNWIVHIIFENVTQVVVEDCFT